MDPVKAIATLAFSKIEIESDGTNAGTKILLNGKKIVGLASLAFNFYNSDYSPVSLGYRVEDGKYEAGTLQSSTYFSLIPPKAKAADGSAQAVASVGGSGFILQSSEIIPMENFRSNERLKAYAQI